MRIGEVAKHTGFTVKAIRHYEAQGLLGTVPRRGRYRAFARAQIERLQHVRRAKELGMTLGEIRAIVGASPCVASERALVTIEAKMRQRVADIGRATRDLQRLRAAHAAILDCMDQAG